MLNACLGSVSASRMTVIMQVKFQMHAQADICHEQTMEVIAPELINTRINSININTRILNLSQQLSHCGSPTTYIYLYKNYRIKSYTFNTLWSRSHCFTSKQNRGKCHLQKCCLAVLVVKKGENTSCHCQLEKLPTKLVKCR